MSLSVELQPRDAGWVKLGTQQDGGYGVVPCSIEFDGDASEYGCLSASFRLKLNPRWPRAILEQFTPVVIKDGNDDRWSGRIIAVPTTFAEDAEVVVQCQGWGQHTKDDCTDREWVIADLSRLVDQRSIPSAQLGLAKCYAGAQVNVGEGSVTLMSPSGSPLTTGGAACVTLDLGPNNLATRFVATYESSANTANQGLYMQGYSNADLYGTGSGTGTSVLNSAAASGTLRWTTSPATRYVHIYMYTTAGYTPGADVWFKITSLKVFTNAADESGDLSILKAPTVISDVLAAVCPNISSDRSKIQATTFGIPNFPGSPGWRYGNELIDAANAYHGYGFRLSPDPVPVAEFGPLDSDYSFVVGAEEYRLAEPAAQDGRSVFSRVISEFEDAAGVRSYATAENPYIASRFQFNTGSFEGGVTAGWTATSGSIAASTTVAFTGSYSAQLSTAFGTFGFISPTILTGQSEAKKTVRLRLYRTTAIGQLIVRGALGTTVTTINTTSGAAGYNIGPIVDAAPVNTWVTVDVPITTAVGGEVKLSLDCLLPGGSGFAGVVLYMDDVELYEGAATVVDRRGMRRTALKAMDGRSTAAAALQVAQLELDAAQFPPFKGTISVTGRIRTKGGGSIAVSALPARVLDSLLIENLQDPNTGAFGRQGIIRTAKYTEATDTVEIGIDDPQDFISVVRARLSAATR
ncbi:MAG: hypothetical protein JWM98_1820 [Thermoleophilia bacterium]|nr:hypothetical protein [Thermoleophilia bacterium]